MPASTANKLIKQFKSKKASTKTKSVNIQARNAEVKKLDELELKSRRERFEAQVTHDRQEENKTMKLNQSEAAKLLATSGASSSSSCLEISTRPIKRLRAMSPVVKRQAAKRTAPIDLDSPSTALVNDKTPFILENFNETSTDSVFASDSKSGIRVLETTAAEWIPLVQALTRAAETGTTASICGEYNSIFSDLENFKHLIPNLEGLDCTSVVLRVTRSDSEPALTDSEDGEEGGETIGTPRFRYRSLSHQIEEIKTTLHAAAHGFALPVYATLLYPGPEVNGRRLFGCLMVLKRAQCSLQDLLGDAHSYTSRMFGVHKNSDACKLRVHRSAMQAASSLLPSLIAQARSKVINLDCKPANIMVNDSVDGSLSKCKFFIADFDCVLSAVVPWQEGTGQMAENIAAHMILLLLHLRVFLKKEIADGFAAAWRPVLLYLVNQIRSEPPCSTSWLWNTDMRRRSILLEKMSSPGRIRKRFLGVVQSYFDCASRRRFFRMDPKFNFSEGGDRAIVQLVRFVLLGNRTAYDVAVERALGNLP